MGEGHMKPSNVSDVSRASAVENDAAAGLALFGAKSAQWRSFLAGPSDPSESIRNLQENYHRQFRDQEAGIQSSGDFARNGFSQMLLEFVVVMIVGASLGLILALVVDPGPHNLSSILSWSQDHGAPTLNLMGANKDNTSVG
jgi:hypothetical protein